MLKVNKIIVAAFVMICLFTCCMRLSTNGISDSEKLPDVVDFNFHIKPLLSDRCFKCHGPDANKRKADLRLDSDEFAFANTDPSKSKAGKVLKPGSPSNSELYRRITSEESDYMMPPPESNLKLTDYEKSLIEKWIDQGAEYKKHWSFINPEKAKGLHIENDGWATSEIDMFILNKIERVGLEPAEIAEKTTLLRRITIDLTGLPPTPTEIKDFVADASPDGYEKAIDRLMSSSHYGERMALEWLDVARYADSHGYQDDGMRNTWPWRDWVIDAYNENQSYDQFLLEQLAGDMLPNATKKQILATCFNRNHPQSQEGGVVDEEYRVEYVADRTNTFGKAFLGLTMECARCHDHKYDPISQKDYYAMYALFNSNNDSGIVPYNGEASPTVMLPTEEEEQKLAELNAKMEPLEVALATENYKTDLAIWLEKNQSPVNLSYGLVADFNFENELEVDKTKLNLDGKKSPGWAGVGNKGTTTGYINKVKNRPDAIIFGDKDRKPLIVPGKKGKGIHMQGDCGIRFNRDMDYDRYNTFSVSIWVKLLKEGEKGPIFNNTNGDFEGYRGWICKLNEDGTLSYQLNHVWPDNCIDYRTTQKLKVNEWTHVAMTYDGSSAASGFALYINGEKAASDLLKDNLQRSLQHGADHSNWSSFPFMLGKEKERSIENVLMDELKIYNRQLSVVEVKLLADPNADINNYDPIETYLLAGNNSKYNEVVNTLTELRKEENDITTNVLEVMVMKDLESPRQTYILDRGAYDAPTEKVNPAVPEMLKNGDVISNRLALAQWLTSKENPLTARIAVNRLWSMLFGKGIVSTQDDFGNQGGLPSHPELLDWLAVDFMDNGWDIKALLKKIMLSSTYRQSSQPSSISKEGDIENELYTRYPAHRLSAESIRDNALAASGLLSKKIGGPSVYPYQPEGIWKALATRNATNYKQSEGEDLYRRSIYTVWKRSSPPPAMMNFDAPDRYLCVVNRQKTATPLQSLVLMNDPQFTEAAKAMAERSMIQGGDSHDQRISYIFQSLIGRAPDEQEVKTLKQLYQEEYKAFSSQEDRARELLEVGEYELSEDVNVIEAAGYMMLASTVMNFDEFVMKR